MKLINSALKYQPDECGSSLPGKILSHRRNKLVLIITRMVGNVINSYIGRAHRNDNLARNLLALHAADVFYLLKQYFT